jgi:hypothetical protein
MWIPVPEGNCVPCFKAHQLKPKISRLLGQSEGTFVELYGSGEVVASTLAMVFCHRIVEKDSFTPPN